MRSICFDQILANMTIVKRRLSKGSNLLPIPFEDEIEENEIDPMAEINSGLPSNRNSNSRNSGRNSNNGRRGSLFGALKNASPSKIATEQRRLADMYKTVIQLSTENVGTHFIPSLVNMTLITDLTTL
jgi:hypothetical protein